MENQKVYNLPSGNVFKIKQDIFIIKNGKTLKIKFDSLSNELTKAITKRG